MHPFFHIVLLKSSIDFLLELVHILETDTFIRSIIAIFGSIADPSVWNTLSRTALELIGFTFIHVNRIGSSSFYSKIQIKIFANKNHVLKSFLTVT